MSLLSLCVSFLFVSSIHVQEEVRCCISPVLSSSIRLLLHLNVLHLQFSRELFGVLFISSQSLFLSLSLSCSFFFSFSLVYFISFLFIFYCLSLCLLCHFCLIIFISSRFLSFLILLLFCSHFFFFALLLLPLLYVFFHHALVSSLCSVQCFASLCVPSTSCVFSSLPRFSLAMIQCLFLQFIPENAVPFVRS